MMIVMSKYKRPANYLAAICTKKSLYWIFQNKQRIRILLSIIQTGTLKSNQSINVETAPGTVRHLNLSISNKSGGWWQKKAPKNLLKEQFRYKYEEVTLFTFFQESTTHSIHVAHCHGCDLGSDIYLFHHPIPKGSWTVSNRYDEETICPW